MMHTVLPFDFVIFGGVGNLSERKLIPALYRRYKDKEFSEPSRIIVLSRHKMSDEEFKAFCSHCVSSHVSEFNPKDLDAFLKLFLHLNLDAKTGEGFLSLKEKLDIHDRHRIFYLAVAPDLFSSISKNLMDKELITPKSRIVVEKPIGHDFSSAEKVNNIIGSYFQECQIFRIDHYLGKETVQNLMALRFANAMYELQWNSAHIDYVQISVSETVGLEDRVSYYDKAGALRDMVQNHLLQLLCLVAMEPPSSMEADCVRDEKLKVLRSLKPMSPKEVLSQTIRGQYETGFSPEGVLLKSYREELGKDSHTETFVAIRAEIANWRWGGVPFYLRTGKRLASRVSEIVIQFRKIPHSIFQDDENQIPENQLVIRLQPDEGIKQFIMIKDPRFSGMRLRQISLDMTFEKSFQSSPPDAYERLLMDVVRGNQTLFMRRDEVEAAWAWVTPILKAWETGNQKVFGYTSGSFGPEEANKIPRIDGYTWRETNQ